MRCRKAEPRAAKFGNIPTRNPSFAAGKEGGRLFDSRLESGHATLLAIAYRAGKIAELRPDPDNPRDGKPRYALEVFSTQLVEQIAQAIDDGDLEEAKRLRRFLPRSRIRVCTYIPDFVYRDDKGRLVVEDTKGYETPLFSIKERLMIACHDIAVVKVRR